MSSGDSAKRRSGSRSASTARAKKTNSARSASTPQSESGGEQAELVVPMDVGKEDALVLEVEKARKRSRPHQVLEEAFGRVVGGDAGGEHAPRATPFVQEGPHGLREYGVEVDVAAAAEGIAAGTAYQMAPPLGLAQGVEERPVEFGVIVREGSDHALPCRRVGRVRNRRAPLREPLLFLELHRSHGGFPSTQSKPPPPPPSNASGNARCQ